MNSPDASAAVLDTSAAVPYVMRAHPSHLAMRRHLAGRDTALTTHSLAETYSVLTRLPGDARLAPRDAARLLTANFPDVVAPDVAVTHQLAEVLAPMGIAGGAVYDALVGLAAKAAGLVLVTRDARALGTYRALGARIEVVT